MNEDNLIKFNEEIAKIPVSTIEMILFFIVIFSLYYLIVYVSY